MGFARGYENMRQPAVRVHKKGSFGLAFVSALLMTNLTMTNHRRSLIVWLWAVGTPEEKGSANKVAGSQPPVVPVKLISSQSNHKRTDH